MNKYSYRIYIAEFVLIIKMASYHYLKELLVMKTLKFKIFKIRRTV